MADGRKFDVGKPRHSLLRGPLRPVIAGVVRVMTFGAVKYDDDNWVDVADGLWRYVDAQDRHWDKIMLDGEHVDSETGEPHAFHYACCALIVAFFLAFRPDYVEAERKRCRGGAER